MATNDKPKIKPVAVGVPLVFRVFLFFGVILIAFVFIYYTQHVVGKLKANSLRMVNLSIKLLQAELSNENSGEATGVIFDEIIAPTDIPIIITDKDGVPLFFRNIEGIKPETVTSGNIDRLKQIVDQMYHINGRFPIKHVDDRTNTEMIINYFYYGDPKLIRNLQAMPFVEIGLVAIFILVGYIGYRNIKRSEQHFIWVGMAKETAHQLGTPISSLMGWHELLRSAQQTTTATPAAPKIEYDPNEISRRIEMDIERLQKIANRFSQIGSRPALATCDLNQIIENVIAYFQERLPRRGSGNAINFVPGEIPKVRANLDLINWVVENLIKNSLEACDPMTVKVVISTSLSADGKTVLAEFKDNGKGIHPAHQKKIFHPGFTTKKLGWGLGLSLARRIVEEYHKGKISLKTSVPNVETIIMVGLPADLSEPKV